MIILNILIQYIEYCDLFIDMKNIADGFTNGIFKKKYNSYDLTGTYIIV